MGAAAIPLAIGAVGAGTGLSIMGTLKQGEQEQQLANARSNIDIQNAAYAKTNADERAKIQAERGRRLLDSQEGQFSAQGIMTKIGSPLTVKAQGVSDMTQDINFILEEGGQQSQNYLAEAKYERQYGAMKKQQSVWDAISKGITGVGSIAFMGYEGGLWGGAAGNAPGTAQMLSNSPEVNAWLNTNPWNP